MHYLCLIYVLRASIYLSNIPSYVKTWKLSAVTHDTCSKHISGQEVTGDLHSLSQESLIQATVWQEELLFELTGNHKRDIAENDAMQFNIDEYKRHRFFSVIKVSELYLRFKDVFSFCACVRVCLSYCLYAQVSGRVTQWIIHALETV